jgi:hypothetical protein
VSFGGASSYLKPKAAGALTLPAASWQRPIAFASAEFGLSYRTTSQAATPLVASVPANATATAWLYQPFRSGTRAGLAPVTAGGVASYRRPNDALAVLPALSVQEPVTVADALSGPE